MKTLIFLCLFSMTAAHASSSCGQPEANECEYYLCLEELKHCGKKGYLTSFAYKYCKQFRDLHQFKPKTQMVLESIRNCLLNQMADYPLDKWSCGKLKRRAIFSHARCYQQAGYCDLPAKEKGLIIKKFKRELWRPLVWGTGLHVVLQCNYSKVFKKTSL